MKISAGLILTDNEIMLICKVGKDRYDLPKGEIDEGETPLRACIREVREETGLQITTENLEDLGQFSYLVDKDLHLFKLVQEKLPPLHRMKCTSYYTDDMGKRLPEIIGYKYIHNNQIQEYMSAPMLTALTQVI